MRLVFHGVRGGYPKRKGKGCSAISLISDKTRLLVDAGAKNILTDIKPLTSLDGVLLTHTHFDHVLYLKKLVDRMENECKKKDMRYHINIYSPKRHNIMLRKKRHYGEFLSYCVLHDIPGQIGDISIEYFRTNHRVINYAYKLTTKEKNVVITGDTSYMDDLAEFARDTDALVIETSYGGDLPRTATRVGHMTLPGVVKLAEKAYPKILIATHYVTVSEEKVEEYLSENYDGKYLCAKKGLELII